MPKLPSTLAVLWIAAGLLPALPSAAVAQGRSEVRRSAAPPPTKVLEDYSRAVALFEEGKADLALREFQSCLRRSPRYAAAAKMIGACYVRLGDPKSALPSFRHALDLDPQNGELMLLLASLYREDGQTSIAEAFLRAAEQRLGSTPEVEEEWILLSRATGRHEELERRLLAQIEADPRNRRAREQRIDLLREQKDFAAAAEAARALAAVFPEDSNASLRVAHLYVEGQLYVEAAKELELLARRSPDPRPALRVLIDLYTTKLPNAERRAEHEKRLQSLVRPRRTSTERR